MRTRTFFPALGACALFALLPQLLHAQQTGTITGKVVDASTGEPVIRATVQITGTKLGAFSNTSGIYTLKNVPAGTHTLRISSIGYTVKTVEGVKVDGGRAISQDVTLSWQTVTSKEVTVTAKASRQSDNALLTERKRSSQVSDGISADQIARAPASDAGDAMKRVTGVSVVGGKYVVVRGLTERYSATQLNGVNLPSPEPEKKVVPFDMFPTNTVSQITTVKTFTPDNPGDFAGGMVKITTKDFPESFLLSFSAGSGFNTQATGNKGLSYPGESGFLGTDNGSRALPANLPYGRLRTSGEQADLLARFGSDAWQPRTSQFPINQSYSASIGNQYDIGFPIGFLLSGSYAGSSSYRESREQYPLLEINDNSGRHELRYDYDTRDADRSVLWGGLLNVSAQPAPEHKVSFRGIFNHSADDETNLVTGQINQSTREDIRYSRLRFVERSLWSMQLSGEHQIEGLLNSKIEWRGALSGADRSEPDNRSTTYLLGDDGVYSFANNFGSNNGRFFSDLADRESNLALDWSIPFSGIADGASRVKVGGLGRFRSRDFSVRRFLLNSGTSDEAILSLSPEELFTPANVASGAVIFNDETQPNDNYSADERISAGYAMVDMPVTSALRLVAGVRLEGWNLTLKPINPMTGYSDPTLSVTQDKLDLLPSINLIYSIGDEMNVRGSFSRTLARPEFRELAPFRFDDYRQSTYGNPALERTNISNADLRWEWFPRGGEVIAVSGFYKRFQNPIEQVYLLGGSGISVEPANASHATSIGAEFELRKALDFITPALEDFSLGTNLTLVKSEVQFSPGDTLTVFDGVGLIPYSAASLTDSTSPRPLQGQSPFVINAALGYNNRSWGTTVNLLYNVFGRRLATVGSAGIPDTYEEARHSLDLSVSQRLPAGLLLKLTARNLLDAETILRQEFTGGETVDVERYTTGRSLSIGLSFSLDQLELQQAE